MKTTLGMIITALIPRTKGSVMTKERSQWIFMIGYLWLGMGIFAFAGGGYSHVVGVASNDTLTVRAKPSSRSKKIGALQPYDTGLVIWKRQRVGHSYWCSVAFLQEDVMGYLRGLNYEYNWVNCRYLSPARDILYSDGFPLLKRDDPMVNLYRVTGVAIHDRLNVREHPRKNARIIGHLRPDDIHVEALKCQQIRSSRWCFVAYDYSMGWAMGPGSTKVPYAQLGWVNMHYLGHDRSGRYGRFPKGMMFPGEVY